MIDRWHKACRDLNWGLVCVFLSGSLSAMTEAQLSNTLPGARNGNRSAV